MIEPQKPLDVDASRQIILTQHPNIGGEIQGAINTLRKLQQITGTLVSDSAPFHAGDKERPGPAGEREEVNAPAYVEVPLLKAGESFGRYQVTRSLGCGAMGAVYLAYDSQLQRYVALKTPFLGRSRDIIERFYREARATAHLRSPYLCPIYDVGEISQIHYLSMAFIDGQPLERAIADGLFKDQLDAAKLVQKVARGLQKAHEQGVIHRDLKPENIMIDSDGEPIVMDFGLARRMDEDIQFTAPGRLLGTPAYMSPEQVEGDSSKIGPASDIYSLGVVLYKLLTGQIPFQGSLTSVLQQIGNTEPPRPSLANPAIAAESPIEKLCLKMMAKAPVDRPPSMAAVVEALERIVAGDAAGSSFESKPSAMKRFLKWSRRILFHQRKSGDSKVGTQANKDDRDDRSQSIGRASGDTDKAARSSEPGTRKAPISRDQSEQTIELASGDSDKDVARGSLPGKRKRSIVVDESLRTIDLASEDYDEKVPRSSEPGTRERPIDEDLSSGTIDLESGDSDEEVTSGSASGTRKRSIVEDESLGTIDLESGDSGKEVASGSASGTRKRPIVEDESLGTIDLESGNSDEEVASGSESGTRKRPIVEDESLGTIDLESENSDKKTSQGSQSGVAVIQIDAGDASRTVDVQKDLAK